MAEDADKIVEFQLAMALESEHISLDLSTVQKGVARVFQDSHRGHYYVAEASQFGVIASTLIQSEWSDWRNGEVWWIHSVYVIPEWRRRGVFRAIYQEIKHKAESRGDIRGLRLYVEKENFPAQKTYQALAMDADRYALFEWMKTF